MPKADRFLLLHAAIGCVLLVAGLLFADRALAEYWRAAGLEGLAVLMQGTMLLDLATGKELSKFLPGLVLAVAALVSLALRRGATRALLLVGATHLSSTLVAGVSKNFFGRLRPFEVMQNADWAHAWWVGGSSFPSGHAGFYFGLFLPLAWLFPRWRWPLVLIPWFIAVARVNANHHFVSDVAASIVVAALLTLLLANAGRVLTHRQILREVWGPSHVDDAHYLRVYMAGLRRKLEADSTRPRHFITEAGVGYRLVLE